MGVGYQPDDLFGVKGGASSAPHKRVEWQWKGQWKRDGVSEPKRKKGKHHIFSSAILRLSRSLSVSRSAFVKLQRQKHLTRPFSRQSVMEGMCVCMCVRAGVRWGLCRCFSRKRHNSGLPTLIPGLWMHRSCMVAYSRVCRTCADIWWNVTGPCWDDHVCFLFSPFKWMKIPLIRSSLHPPKYF